MDRSRFSVLCHRCQAVQLCACHPHQFNQFMTQQLQSYDSSVPFTVFLSAPLRLPRLLKLQHQPPRCTVGPQWLLYFSVKEQPVYWVDADTGPHGGKESGLVNHKSRMITKKMLTFLCPRFFLFERRCQTWRRPLSVRFGSWVLSHLFYRNNAHWKRLSH